MDFQVDVTKISKTVFFLPTSLYTLFSEPRNPRKFCPVNRYALCVHVTWEIDSISDVIDLFGGDEAV